MGGNQRPHVPQIAIKINGSNIPAPLMNSLVECEVETTMYLPSMFSLRFNDDELQWVDNDTLLKPGASVEIQLPDPTTRALTAIFKGEITAVEPEFIENSLAVITVRGYDRAHRLHRGSKARVFVNSSDGDIATKIAGENSLTPSADSTTQIYEHVFQDHKTDFEFLQERAWRNGFEVFVDDKTLYFRKPKGTRGQVTLEWGTSLRSFRPRLSAAGQINEVTVKGWDPKQKKEIVGQAASSSLSPQVGLGSWGGATAQQAFSGAAKKVEIHQGVMNQSEADTIAQSILDQINSNFIEADGVAFGNPGLLAGEKVKLEKIGTRFGGTYIVTSARHAYTLQGYDTYFTVEGRRPHTFAELVGDSNSEGNHEGMWSGVVPALVTNNNDDEGKMGRVKLKFPWLDGNLESAWARVASVGAGNGYGFYWLPEVGDEVLVAFEHGDFNRPYVIGSLWNGKDAPPESAAVENGKVTKRTLKTTEGHIIRLTDGSASMIEIIDSKTNTSIKMDTTNQKITITSKADISIEATGKLTLKGANVSVEATSQLDLKGAQGNLEASGPLKVKGAVVNIN